MFSLARNQSSGLTSKYVTWMAKDSDSDSDNGDVELLRDPTARLAPSTRTRLTPVPDLDGRRYCRVCKDFMPLTAFPRGQRRFTCRAHLWQRIGKRAQQKLSDKPRKKLLARMWMQLWKDRRVFGQTVVALKQADINALLEAFLGGGSDKSKDGLTVLPRDPSVPVSNGNAVLVMKQARRELLAGYRQHEAGTYQSKLQQALSSLEHAQKPATRGRIEMSRPAADFDVFR
jgi:hypothetical protein